MTSKPLPILVPALREQRFSCHGCTHCCRDLAVHLTESDRMRIDEQGWEGKIDRPAYVRLAGAWVLNHVPGHGCVFLDGAGKCLIHTTHGPAAKPIGCQLYPFTLWPTPRGWRMAYRFDCPSIADSKGAPVTSQLADLERMVQHLRRPRTVVERVRLKPRRPASEIEIEAVLAGLDRWLAEHATDVAYALSGLNWLTETVAAARANKVRDQRFSELIEVLVAGMAGDLDGATSPPPPTDRQRKMLRQVVFAHCQAITLVEARAGWPARLRRMLAQFAGSRRFSAGRGLAPSLAGEPAVAFEAVEAVGADGADAERVGELVIRYLRAQVLTRSCFGPLYYDWDMISGLRALLLRTCAWGYLARVCTAAAGRHQVDHPSALRALNLIARTAGLAPALGRRTERLRLTYLQSGSGIERLLRAYPLAGGV